MAQLVNVSGEFHRKWMQFYNETIKFESTIGIIIPTIFACVVIIGLVGNLLVVIVALNRQMINSTNALIIGNTFFFLNLIPITIQFQMTSTSLHAMWD